MRGIYLHQDSGTSFLVRLAWALLVITNVFLVHGTLARLRSLRSPLEFSYLDMDRPLIMPVGDIDPVEMTFHDSARFGLSNDTTKSDNKDNWDTLWSNQLGLGYQHIGPFQFQSITGMYHTLHCLWTMEIDFDKPNHLTNPSPHFAHCLFVIRQYLLCNADMTIEAGDFMKRNITTDRVGETRTCRNWKHVADWVDEEVRNWITSFGIDVSDIGKIQALGDQVGNSLWRTTKHTSHHEDHKWNFTKTSSL